MDRPEELAMNYLITQGYSPVYEPLGKSTCPDFEINESTAVEVRRLNENHFDKTRPEALLSVSQSIWDGIESVFASHKKENPKQNYWVSLRIKRPVEKMKIIKKKLNESLDKFISKSDNEEDTIRVSSSITLRLIPKSELSNQIFHLGSQLDFDAGGFVLPNLLQNLNYCIKQKTNKINSCIRQYDNWWLILIDEISYGLTDKDKIFVTNEVTKPPVWEKIITLNTLNGKEILTI